MTWLMACKRRVCGVWANDSSTLRIGLVPVCVAPACPQRAMATTAASPPGNSGLTSRASFDAPADPTAVLDTLNGGSHEAVTPHIPSFTRVFTEVCAYEQQYDAHHAGVTDLAAVCCLLREPSAPTGLQDAFRVMDAENGKLDGRLSLSETKRLLCAVMTVVREVRAWVAAGLRARPPQPPACVWFVPTGTPRRDGAHTRAP